MISKFSVRKPLTVFVAVVLIIVLGVVSVDRMTPDLLPELDLPYVVLFTPYYGATPETVESDVTRPMEQEISSIENVENVSSTSAENYSLIWVQVASSTNMDVLKIDLQSALNTLAASFPNGVGTTTVLEMSPDIIPSLVSTVDYDNMDQMELSNFVEGELLPKLEGIEGVAAVITSGVAEQTVEVVIDPDKLDAMNELLYAAITEQFNEATEELDAAREALEEGYEQIAEGEEQLAEGEQQYEQGVTEAEQATSSAKAQLDAADRQLRSAKAELTEKRAELVEQLEYCQSMEQQLTELESTITKLEYALAVYERAIANIESNSLMSDERKAELIAEITESEGYQSTVSALAQIDAQLAAQGMTRDDVPAKIAELQAAEAQLEDAIAQVDAAIEQVDAGLEQVQAGYAALNSAGANADAQLAAALAELEKGQAALDEAKTQADESAEQLAEAEKLANEQLQAILDSADLTNILTLKLFATIIAAQNYNLPAGYITDGDESILVSVGDKIADVDELSNLVITDTGFDSVGVIKLSDVATIETTDTLSMSFAKINDSDGVLISFTKQSSYATMTVTDNIKERIAELEQQYDGLHFTAMLDQGAVIDLSLGTVTQNLIVGALLAIIILLLFLRDLRPTFMVACSIPISVMFALVLMYFSGVTLNLFSMAGLAVGVGMLVDNSIVVIENIYRLRQNDVPVKEAALQGAKQVAAAITSSTLTTICVFAPIVFVQGLTRELFSDMALTITYSLLASLIIALTLIPAMVTKMLKKPVKKHSEGYKKRRSLLERLTRWTLGKRALCLIVAVLLLAGSAWLCVIQGFSLIPESGGLQVMLSVTPPEGTSYEDTMALAAQVHEGMMQIEGLSDVGTMVSSGLASVIGISVDSETGSDITCYALIDENSKVSTKQINAEIDKLMDEMPEGSQVQTMSTSAMSFTSSLGGDGIEVMIYGDKLDDLANAEEQVRTALEGVDGIKYIESSIASTEPALHITVDKNEARLNDLTVGEVYMAVATALTSSAVATEIAIDDNSVDVEVVSGEALALDAEGLKELQIEATALDGTTHKVKLSDIASFEYTTTLSSITRSNQRRYASVTATVKDDYSVTLVSANAQKALSGLELSGVELEYEGESESILSSLSDLVWMLAIGILLIYLIMVAQFQSLKSPFIVMFTLPLAFTGGFIGLLIAGMDVSIVSMVGMIMLVGVAVNNGIVLVDTINQLREGGMEKREAIVEAVKMRIRPVLMTAVTTILGLLPLALGIGTGAEMIQPVAVVCVGGLTYATLTTLLIIPIMYDLFNPDRKKKTGLPPVTDGAEAEMAKEPEQIAGESGEGLTTGA